jgi:single-strand DNA-binding protein
MPASNVNVVVITGNLTQDPDLRETGAGTPVCELRVANNASIKKDGEWVSKPNFFQVNVWGGMAENCNKYLSKGSKVAINGRLEWQKWESEVDGEKKTNSRVVIVANQVEFLNTKPKEDKSDGDDIPF